MSEMFLVKRQIPSCLQSLQNLNDLKISSLYFSPCYMSIAGQLRGVCSPWSLMIQPDKVATTSNPKRSPRTGRRETEHTHPAILTTISGGTHHFHLYAYSLGQVHGSTSPQRDLLAVRSHQNDHTWRLR